MMKKSTNKDLSENENETEVAKPVTSASKAIVLEEFVFQICLSPGLPSYTQIFARKTIVNNPMLIRQMLDAKKPIEIIE